ncbi:MAG TPA: APC family permease [Acidimicrobiales bacterium]|nr:APC family permease [Acidimicrobiales bacterium]
MATQEIGQEQALGTEGLKRDVGLLGLTWASEGSIIGSGWLFAALYATEIAGPSAILGWIIATIIIIPLALVHAELGGLFPVSGGTSRYPHYAFGSLAGGTFGWFAYIQAATVAPIEVLAVIQYTSVASWASSWYKPPGPGQLSGSLHGWGIAAAIILLVVFVIINLIGIRWLANVNSTVTTWKVIVPIVAILVLMITHFHSGNFTASTCKSATSCTGGGFFEPGGSGTAWKDIFIAIPGAGIVFSLLGFEQAVQLGGESKNPRDLPRAVIYSIIIGAAIYILAQVAFIAALDPKLLFQFSKPGTYVWSNLVNATGLNAAPYYTISTLAGLSWLAYILRFDAVISPAGTGLVYTTSTSRISFGLSKNGYIPRLFETNTGNTKVPAWGIIISACIGILFLLPYPSWNSLVSIVTGASVLMYAGAPLALGALRQSKPNLPRTYRYPAANLMAPLAFAGANLIVYWAGWYTVGTLMIVILIGYLLMLVSRAFGLNDKKPVLDFKSGIWIPVYLAGMALISYFGNFGVGYELVGGIGWFKTHLIGPDGKIHFWWDMLIVVAFSFAIYFWAVASRLPENRVDDYIRDVYPPSGELVH